MGIFAPSKGKPCFRNYGSKLWICEHIGPRSGSCLSLSRNYNIFPPIGSKTSQSVKENKVIAGGRQGAFGTGNSWPCRQSKVGNCIDRGYSAFYQLRQRVLAVGNNDPGNCLHQDSVFFSYAIGRKDKNPPRFPKKTALSLCNEPHDLVMQKLPVPGLVFIPDYQVNQ